MDVLIKQTYAKHVINIILFMSLVNTRRYHYIIQCYDLTKSTLSIFNPGFKIAISLSSAKGFVDISTEYTTRGQ